MVMPYSAQYGQYSPLSRLSQSPLPQIDPRLATYSRGTPEQINAILGPYPQSSLASAISSPQTGMAGRLMRRPQAGAAGGAFNMFQGLPSQARFGQQPAQPAIAGGDQVTGFGNDGLHNMANRAQANPFFGMTGLQNPNVGRTNPLPASEFNRRQSAMQQKQMQNWGGAGQLLAAMNSGGDFVQGMDQNQLHAALGDRQSNMNLGMQRNQLGYDRQALQEGGRQFNLGNQTNRDLGFSLHDTLRSGHRSNLEGLKYGEDTARQGIAATERTNAGAQGVTRYGFDTDLNRAQALDAGATTRATIGDTGLTTRAQIGDTGETTRAQMGADTNRLGIASNERLGFGNIGVQQQQNANQRDLGFGNQELQRQLNANNYSLGNQSLNNQSTAIGNQRDISFGGQELQRQLQANQLALETQALANQQNLGTRAANLRERNTLSSEQQVNMENIGGLRDAMLRNPEAAGPLTDFAINSGAASRTGDLTPLRPSMNAASSQAERTRRFDQAIQGVPDRAEQILELRQLGATDIELDKRGYTPAQLATAKATADPGLLRRALSLAIDPFGSYTEMIWPGERARKALRSRAGKSLPSSPPYPVAR